MKSQGRRLSPFLSQSMVVTRSTGQIKENSIIHPCRSRVMADYALLSNELVQSYHLVPLPDNLAKAMQLILCLIRKNGLYPLIGPKLFIQHQRIPIYWILFNILVKHFLRKEVDCDDLVALYCSLMENAGIPTAFIDVPGTYFMAFDLNIP